MSIVLSFISAIDYCVIEQKKLRSYKRAYPKILHNNKIRASIQIGYNFYNQTKSIVHIFLFDLNVNVNNEGYVNEIIKAEPGIKIHMKASIISKKFLARG